MKAKLIGSGCWQGIPAPFCKCDICTNKSQAKDSKNFRFRTSYLIENKGKKIMVDATPDIRLQTNANKLDKVDAFLITHWHWDHLFGLKDIDLYLMREEKPTIYCSQETKQWLDSQFGYLNLKVEVLEPYKTYNICGIEVTPFLVKHTAESFGYLVDKKLAILGDYFEVPQESLDLINSVETVVGDGTYLVNAIGYDKTHLQTEKITEFLSSLKCKNKIIANISCIANKDHEELQDQFKNFKIAYDGLELA
jgi:phosphoribosyl 1,2-cyclic phosphate phosphodiesterase